MIAYSRPRSMYTESGGIGLRIPAFCSAVGRVLLAGLPAERRAANLAAVQPTALTPHTVTDPGKMVALIEEIDTAGYALAEQEVELGFRSLAVPVRRRNGNVEFALNIGMSVHRVPLGEMQGRFVPLLQEAAERLRGQLL
jgi:IclR family pca regulon transcriptional regulator